MDKQTNALEELKAYITTVIKERRNFRAARNGPNRSSAKPFFLRVVVWLSSFSHTAEEHGSRIILAWGGELVGPSPPALCGAVDSLAAAASGTNEPTLPYPGLVSFAPLYLFNSL